MAVKVILLSLCWGGDGSESNTAVIVLGVERAVKVILLSLCWGWRGQ